MIELTDEEKAMANRGHRLLTIQSVRARTRCTLKEAMKEVDPLVNAHKTKEQFTDALMTEGSKVIDEQKAEIKSLVAQLDSYREVVDNFRALDDKRICEKDKLRDRLGKAGICPHCLEEYEHEVDAPFANCRCGTSEWAVDGPAGYPLLFGLRKMIKDLVKVLELRPLHNQGFDAAKDWDNEHRNPVLTKAEKLLASK